MNGRHSRPWLLAVAVGSLVAASCGGSDTADVGDTTTTAAPSASSTTPAVTDPPATDPTTSGPATTAAPDTVGIASVEDIRPAVVQVLAQGSFRDPLEGQQSGGWTGSGFLIDPDGVIVTNNHVVTGAGAVKVRMDDGEEIPAQVVGVSECNDLAVLQLVDPGPYAYLEWYDGEIAPPLEVYTAGFPLGDPEYTITRGIVSKAEAEGRTQWASVRHVIEHDAAIQPGNSGGPLVSADGRVVGINYAGFDPGTGTVQYKAIAADLAIPLVAELREGDDETIGINGQAVVSDDQSLVGVWVFAVEAGTPASEAGILAGDVITTLNGVPMSVGTMESYCDVLRSAIPDQPISVQVVRFDTGEVWEGELNGTPMTARYSFADELGDEVAETDVVATYEFETITDDTGTLVVNVPTTWSQRDTAPTDLGLGTGPVASIAAAPDLQAFYDTWDHPGMQMLGLVSGATELGTLDDFLSIAAPDDATCASDGRTDYEDPVFVGRAEVWACGSGSLWVALAASPADVPDAVIFIGVLAVTEADLEALDQVLYSFDFG